MSKAPSDTSAGVPFPGGDSERRAGLSSLPDYDRFIIEAICRTLRKWIDKQRYDVVWLKGMDIDHLEEWATNLAKQYRETELYFAIGEAEELPQPNEGWTPAEPWPH